MKKRLLTVFLLMLALCLLTINALADAAPSFSVSTLTPQYNERVTVTVQAPAGATAVRVWNDGDGYDEEDNRRGRWEYFDRYHNLGWLQTDIMCWDAGSWLVRAAYTTAAYEGWDELTGLEESAWTAIGQDTLLTVAEMLGVMNPPQAHLVSGEVERGEPVRLVIDALQDKDEWYFAELDAWDGSDWNQVGDGHADFDTVINREQVYPTVQLTAGRYRLRLACEAVGYDQAWYQDLNETNLTFTVAEPAEHPPELALYFSSSDALSFEQITFWSWAEGADHVHVTVAMEGNEGWRNDLDGEGGLHRFQWSSSDSGTFVFTLTADDGGVERTAEPFTLRQTAPYGTLAAPEINGVPHVIVVGQSVRGSLSDVVSAQDYHMRLMYRPDNGEDEEVWQDSLGSSRTFSIPGEAFSRTGLYALEAHSHALGFNGGHTGFYPIFVAEEAQTGSSFLVTKTEALTWERFSFSISAPGMTNVMLKVNGGIWGESDGDSLAGTLVFSRPGVYRLQAIATDNRDTGWTQIGDIITINITAPYGQLPVTLTAPASVAPDGTAEVAVTWEHGGQAFDGWLRLYDQRWNELEGALESISQDEGETATTNTYRLLGDQLTEGEVYLLEAVLHPFDAGYEETTVRREVAVVGATQTGTLIVEDTDLLRCEGTEVTVNVPGATALRVHIEQDRWEYIAGGSCTRYWEFFSEGANQVFAQFTTDALAFDEEGQPDWDAVRWTGVTNTVTVNVTVTATLTAPDCTVAEEIVDYGDPFVVTVNTLQGHDEWYMARLQNPDTGERVTDIAFWDEQTRTLRIDTVGVAPGLYNLSVWTDAYGCNSAGIDFFVGIGEPQEEQIYVSLPASPVLSQEWQTVTAYAAGAARIELVITAPDTEINPRTFSAEGDTLREEFVFGNIEGTRHFVFTAYDADGNEISSHETDFEIIAPYGDRPDPRIVMNGVWTAGQDLRFYVDAGDAAYVYVDVVDLSVDPFQVVYEDEDYRFDPPSWVYVIPASSFTAGHRYVIEGFTSGVGYNVHEFSFTVNLLPANPAILTLPALLTEVEDEAFMGIAAQRVTVPEGVTTIGERAFAGCENLLVADLPAHLTTLPATAFTAPVTVYGEACTPLETAAKTCEQVSFIYVGE